MKKKILILGYNDNPAEGHTISLINRFKDLGQEVYHLSLISRFSIVERNKHLNYYLNAHSYRNFLYLLYRVMIKFRTYCMRAFPIEQKYCFHNSTNFFFISAKSILKKSISNPDIIIIGWSDFFVSPQTIYDLYSCTHAKIYIIMVDAHILGGGCHYPCGCNGYFTGCNDCPALKNKRIPQTIYKEKMKYLMSIPFTIVGTSYDIMRAQKVPFLCHKKLLKSVSVPEIPFVKTKCNSRIELGLKQKDFVVMCGAVATSLHNKRKGFDYLIQAVNLLSRKISSKKRVILLIAGDGDLKEYISCENIDVISLGFVEMNKLYTAFYASDIFVSPSIDDSGPMMVNFSILCGTPVVAFPIGIALDLVVPGKTGFLAEYLDPNSLSEGIYSFYSKSSDEMNAYSEKCLSLMESFRNNENPWLEQALA